MNKSILIGRLGADPELRYTGAGKPVCSLSVATNRSWRDDAGNKQEDTQWHRIVVWGKQAESCKEYLRKGRQVAVEGRMQTRSWEDKDGNKRYTTEVVANRVEFLAAPANRGSEQPSSAQAEMLSGYDQDIPF